MSALELNKLSIEELKKIKKTQKNKLKNEFNEYKKHQEKQKLIDEIMGIENQRKISKIKVKSTTKPKQKPKSTTKPNHIKSFDDYFQECINNKKIPKDPPYLKKALERALREYQDGIKH